MRAGGVIMLINTLLMLALVLGAAFETGTGCFAKIPRKELAGEREAHRPDGLCRAAGVLRR